VVIAIPRRTFSLLGAGKLVSSLRRRWCLMRWSVGAGLGLGCDRGDGVGPDQPSNSVIYHSEEVGPATATGGRPGRGSDTPRLEVSHHG
jgi:hypothetical protein